MLVVRSRQVLYDGLNAPDRMLRPMLKQGDHWSEVDWDVALDFVAQALARAMREHGAEAIAALASPSSTLEELYLLAEAARSGSDNVDFRLRQSDFSADGNQLARRGSGTRTHRASTSSIVCFSSAHFAQGPAADSGDCALRQSAAAS